MNDIAEAIERLAREVEAEDDVVRLWAAAAFAIRLGVIAFLSTADDPVEAIVETGEMWADSVAELLVDQPHRRGEILRAAHAVVERLLDGAVLGHSGFAEQSYRNS